MISGNPFPSEGKRTLECSSQELNVGCLILGNFYQVLMERVGEPCVEEVLVSENCEPLKIKLPSRCSSVRA